MLRDPFISGKACDEDRKCRPMYQIKEAQTAVKDKAIKNWDMVTMLLIRKTQTTAPACHLDKYSPLTQKQ